MNQSQTQAPQANPSALLPILLFLVVYLGNGIFFEYIRPEEGQMGFYVVSVVLAFSIALIAAFLQNRERSFDEKIHICAKGIGDDNIVTMLFIFLMAGAFSGIASQAGGASSTANLLLIACAVSQNGGLPLPFCVGIVVGGAMFGDNLSFISDTTIAATKTQGVEMKDKFRTNIKVALPSAIITLVILIVYAFMSRGVSIGTFEFNIWQALPYFIVLAMSILGINVFLVLITGILLFVLVGIFTGSLTYATALASMGSGINGMFETMIVTILVASIAALMKENGGFEAILAFIRKKADSKRGGMYGIAFLTAFMDIATANNTVAIVISAPIARDITKEYGVDPRQTASLLDTCSCIAQGIIPYGAQLLVAANIAKLTSVSLIPFLIYPFVLLVFVVVTIQKER